MQYFLIKSQRVYMHIHVNTIADHVTTSSYIFIDGPGLAVQKDNGCVQSGSVSLAYFRSPAPTDPTAVCAMRIRIPPYAQPNPDTTLTLTPNLNRALTLSYLTNKHVMSTPIEWRQGYVTNQLLSGNGSVRQGHRSSLHSAISSNKIYRPFGTTVVSRLYSLAARKYI